MSKAPWRLSPFDWGDFIKEGALFVNLLGGAVAGVLGALGTLPPWMIRSDRLLVLALFFAFTRVWKTVREEFESDGLWSLIVEGMSPRGSGIRQVKDAVFEIPYLFSITFLPISAVSLQTFAACLILFYVADNFYNLALLKGIAGEAAPSPGRRASRATGRMVRRLTRGRFESAFAILADTVETVLPIGRPHQNTIDREVLTRFFGRRVLLNRLAILLLAADLALALLGPRDVAETAGCLVVAALLVMELLVEPARVLGVQYEPEEDSEGRLLLWTAPAGTRLDEASKATLKRIHEDAFPPRERQFKAEFLLDNTGRHGYWLLLLTERAGDSEAQDLAGYLFLQARPELEIVIFWYLAVDKERRGQGLGKDMVELAISLVRDRWPSVRAVFLEADDKVEDFYRRLDFWLVGNVQYAIPADGAPQDSLVYNPMYFPLRDTGEPADRAFVRKAVTAMAADSFEDRRDDRLGRLKASLADMTLEPPPPPATVPTPHGPLAAIRRRVSAALPPLKR
jgi:GNAT superfamily N-acetyltransferase